MAKKVTRSKTRSVSSGKYKHFHLHGDHTSQKVLVYIFLDLMAGFILGFMLQPYIVEALTSYAAGM